MATIKTEAGIANISLEVRDVLLHRIWSLRDFIITHHKVILESKISIAKVPNLFGLNADSIKDDFAAKYHRGKIY